MSHQFNGVQIAEGVYMDFNEYSEINLQQITQTTSMAELEKSFCQDVATRKAISLPSVKVQFSDKCCHDASVYEQVYNLVSGLKNIVPLPLTARGRWIKFVGSFLMCF
jgi:hypothetical protein